MRNRNRSTHAAFVLLSLAAVLHCGPGRQRVTVMLPPRVDLTALERIGVVEFRSSETDDLGRLATERFTESARRDQGLVRMLDLGRENDVLRSVGVDRWDPETYRTLGREQEVRTILVGELTVARARPSLRVAPNIASGSVSVQVRATLAVRLVEADSGASIWSRTATTARSLGRVDVLGADDVRIASADRDAAYGALVDSLVEQVTHDFHVHWERR